MPPELLSHQVKSWAAIRDRDGVWVDPGPWHEQEAERKRVEARRVSERVFGIGAHALAVKYYSRFCYRRDSVLPKYD